jgi:4-amino-4-deoxy-L-arabinose transferase-like glycosyltransferase
MAENLERGNLYTSMRNNRGVLLAIIVAALVLIRNAVLVWAFSFGYYRDSNLYVSLGSSLFQRGGPFSNGIVSFPYPFLNALTGSASNPLRLVWLQILIGAAAAGALVYVLWRANRALAYIAGMLLVSDLVWGAISRNVMTEGLFVSFNTISLALVVSHYQRRQQISNLEILFAGLFYGWAFIFRPSSLFLTLVFIPLYLWMTRSWIKTAWLTGGFLLIYTALGAFNLWSGGQFRLMGQSGYYTGSPLFVYRLFAPDNGPSSHRLDQYLSQCLPGEDYANMMEPTAGGAKNNDILYGQFIPCLRNNGLDLDQSSQLMTSSYREAILHRPVYYAGVIFREGITFLKYNAPYILRFYLKPELNNQCEDYAWCDHIRQARYSWGNDIPLARVYEKVATKLYQIYLVPIVPLSWILPYDDFLPFAVAWLLLMIFLLITTRADERFLVLIALLFIHYIVLSVVAGYGFLERYGSVLTPFYIVLSATALVKLGEYFWLLAKRLRRGIA